MKTYSRNVFTLGLTEWEIFNICCDLKKSTAKLIYDESLKNANRSYLTVRTILDRLVQKECLKREKHNGIFLYSPKMERGGLIWSTIENLLQIVGETIAPAVAFGVKAGKVSKKELEELKKMINEIEDSEEEEKK